MILNYLKITLRNIRRNRGFSVINIIGLAIGMACCVLILLFVSDELSYDGYHSRADNIYRMVASTRLSGEEREYVPLGAPYALLFDNALPEVKAAARFYPHPRMLVEHEEKKFFEERFFFSDPSVFEIFSFPLRRGNPSTALKSPFSVVLTESMAKKYFGDKNPVGESLKIDNEHIFRIDAVMEDVPPNSHFHFDFLASLETLSDLYGERFLRHPGYLSFYSYVLLQENTDPRGLEAKFQDVVIQNYGERAASLRTIKLQTLKSIHLHSHLEAELEANSSLSFIYIYSAIAFFILLIAAFNFVNLSTARSTKRAQEVGVRKVLGAFRFQLVKQFLGESAVFSLVSLFLAVIIVRVLLPLFNSLAGREISLDFLYSPSLLIGLAGIILVVGILGGLYPALFLSAFEPIRTLKGKWRTTGRNGSFRRFLVVAQFAISIALITGTIVIRNQLHYMRSQNLGFDKEQVVVIPLNDPESKQSYEVIKEELLKNSSILAATASSSVPGKQSSSIAYRVEGLPDDQHISIDTFFVDYDFLETFGIEIAAGRGFSKGFATDEENAFIVNETAVRELNWNDALDKQIIWPSDLRRNDAIVKKGRVVGVVKDFHVTSLHEGIGPVLFQILPSNFRFLSVRIAPKNVTQTLAFLREKWRQSSPAFPFEYSFLDEDFDKLYRADQKVGRIIGIFTTLALFVACLGLFGLASFAAEQRTKEIGIRKVLGASASGIFMLLSREFAKWVLVANILAWPIAYFAMDRWLRNFAYRVTLGVDVFLLSALAALAIALVTVSFQSIKAAVANPVDSLRYE
jgi:putative ABC transport system permease protein